MPQSVRENLIAAFRYLLKPLVRIAIKNAVSAVEFGDALKQAYVDVAVKHIRGSGVVPSEEGISLVTGMQTSEVSLVLRSDTANKFAVDAQETSPLPTVLGGWHTDTDYTGPYGVLRDLQFYSSKTSGEAASSFSKLAATYCPGIPPRALLDELIRTGCVQDVGNGYFRAVKRSYIPDPLSTENIRLFARIVHNICETLEVNLRPESAGGKGLVERTVYTVNGMTKHDLREFDKFVRERGQIFADDVDNWLSDRDGSDGNDRVQTGVGFYHYIVNEDDEQALSKELPN